MKAIHVPEPGGPEALTFGEFPDPLPGEEEIVIRITAAGVNRADILQRQGKYPPPPGAPPFPGLEVAGIVEAVGSRCQRWKVGDRVCTILASGGYAEKVAVHCELPMPTPPNLSDVQAAAIPEVFLTAYQTLIWIGGLQKGEFALIHAGASGVGTAAIQIAHVKEALPLVTAGSDEKIAFCKELGAIAGINYKTTDFAPVVLQETNQHGADVILDPVGAPYFTANLKALATDGRIIYIATMGGARIAECDLRALFKKRAQITASTLRSRSLNYKIDLSREFARTLLPLFTTGELQPVVDKVFSWKDVQEAHRYMEANRNKGKIILTID